MPSLILCFMELLDEYGEYVTCRCTVRPQDVTAITPHVHHIVITSNLSCLLLLELYCRFIDEVIGIICLMKYLLSWFSGTRSFSAGHNNVQQVVGFCNDLWWSLWWYMIYIYIKKTVGKTAPFNSHILGFASYHRPKCVHSQTPPRRPASFIQLVCHKPVSCNSLSLNYIVISSHLLGIKLVCAPILFQLRATRKASCLQRIHFWRKSPGPARILLRFELC